MNNTAVALVVIAFSSLLFSFGGLFVRSLNSATAWQTIFWRSLFAAITIGISVAWRTQGRVISTLAGLGIPGLFVACSFSASSVGMVVALSRTSVAVVLVLFSLAPLTTALIARVMIGEHVRRVTWMAIGSTIVGIGVMVVGGGAHATLVGVLCALMVPVAFGFGIVVIRRHAHITMVPAMLAACIVNCVIAAPFAHPTAVSRHDLGVLLLFGAGQLGVGLTLFALAAPHAPAAQAALVSMIEPVLGPAWVWLFRDEYPGIGGLVGGGIVFTALAIHTVVVARQSPSDIALQPEPMV